HPKDKRYRKYVGKTMEVESVEGTITLQVVADTAVDPKFGTGVIKVTPGHDPVDFEIGRRHNLPVRTVIGFDGRMTERAGKYAGLDRFECRRRIVEDMKALGLIDRIEPYRHAVGVCYRCKTVVEPLISKQWYVRIKPLAEPAIKAVRSGRIKIIPRAWRKTYYHWLENIRDWPISRQLWWGHRIPVWYCDADGSVHVSRTDLAACPRCGGPVRQDPDVLDTWFSSALWPFATLGWPEETPELRAFYPGDVNSTAREIIFLWVARMLTAGLELMGDVPFHDVIIHSTVLAPDGRRMSKSLGNGVDPMDVIEAHGADATRYGLAKMSSTQDVRFSTGPIEEGRRLANKLWNASRLLLMSGADDVEERPSSLEERWILARIDATRAEMERDFIEYDFAHAVERLYHLTFDDFCDWYLEAIKPRLGEPEVKATA